MDDKRQHSRVRDPIVVVKIATIDKFRSYYLSDLSQGGIFIRCEKLLPMSSEVDVKLVAPGFTEPLVLHGRIVRLDSDEVAKKANRVGMGIRFENLLPDSAARLQALVAEHSKPPAAREAPPAVAREEVGELIGELKATRETMALRDRELEESRRRLAESQALQLEMSRQSDRLRTENDSLQGQIAASRSTGSETEAQLTQLRDELVAELERHRAENVELRAQMAELDGQLQAYRAEFQTMETDEAATRALAERLAKEKAALEKRRKEEMAAINAEINRLRADLEISRNDGREENRRGQELGRQLEETSRSAAQLQKMLDAENDAHAKSQALLASERRETERLQVELERVNVVAREVPELRIGLATERAKAASMERQLVESRGKLDRVKVKERELRRLVSIVASQEEEVLVVDEGDEAAPSTEPSPLPEAVAEVPAEVPHALADPPPVQSSSVPEALAEALAALAPPPDAPPEPEPGAVPLPGPEEVAPADVMPLESEAVPDASAPPDPFSWPPPEGVAAQSPDAPALDVDIPIDEDTEQKTTSTKIGAVEFGKLLRLGSRLSRTEWFSRYEPMSDPETKLAAWLAAVDTLPALMNLARGSLSEDTVTVLCYQFYEKNLIDVVGSDGQG